MTAFSSAAAAGGLLAACDDAPAQATQIAAAEPTPDPSAKLYPVMRNLRYRLDRDLTAEDVATTYNNYYEFGSSKNIWQKAQDLPIRPETDRLGPERPVHPLTAATIEDRSVGIEEEDRPRKIRRR